MGKAGAMEHSEGHRALVPLRMASKRGLGEGDVFWGRKDSTVSLWGYRERPFTTRSLARDLALHPYSSSILVRRPPSNRLSLCSESHIVVFPSWPSHIHVYLVVPTSINLLKLPFQMHSQPCSNSSESSLWGIPRSSAGS